MVRIHTDLARIPVSVAPSPATSGTSLGVTDANAALIPDVYPYWIGAVPTGQNPTRANTEISKVTAGSSAAGTTTLTIVRAQGVPVTTAQSISTSFDIYCANSAEEISNGLDTYTNKTMNDLTNYIDADAVHIKAYLNLERAGVIGDAVYVSNWNAGNSCIEVGLAKADAAATMPAIGILETAGNDETVQSVRITGILSSINVNAYSSGTALYVSPTTAGAITSTKPTTLTHLIQRIGTVVQQSTTGQIMVLGAGRTNDVPNTINVVLNAAPATNVTVSGTTVTLNANETQGFGDVCYIDVDSQAHLVDANAIATSYGLFMATASISANADGVYLCPGGFARNDAWNWTPGLPIFITVTGTTTNTMSQTAPTGTNDVVQIIGIATHADRMFFYPQLSQVELV